MKHSAFFITILTALTLQACHFESFKSDEVFINNVDENCALYDLYVDEYGNRGIIAFISNHNFWGDCIIAISADEGNEPWGPMDEAVYKAEGEISFDTITNYYILYHPSFGLMMQQTMLSMGIDRFPAQRWCNMKNQGDPYPNAASWRLPSLFELLLIFENPELNDALISIGGTPLDEDGLYWTCSEDIEGYMPINDSTATYDKENRAIPTDLTAHTYSNKDRWLKKNKYHVRAIKYVYYKI